jgi:hypothetical protein
MFIISLGESSDLINKLERVFTQALLELSCSKFKTFILIMFGKLNPYFSYFLGKLLAVAYVRANTMMAFMTLIVETLGSFDTLTLVLN